ncbi:MAG TPA: hypothetical protein DCO82_13740 [Alphaproteobacteria bacterium]|nr:hypothetical protein [Alphaproteobacteria bacterium]
MRDMITRVTPAIVLEPATLAADNTPVAIDTQGYDGIGLLLAIGVGGITFSGTNKIEFKLSHGDTTTVGSHVAVTAADILADSLTPGTITNGIIRALTAAHAAATVQRIGYVGGKRYLSLLADFSGTHGTGTPICAMLIRGHAAVTV